MLPTCTGLRSLLLLVALCAGVATVSPAQDPAASLPSVTEHVTAVYPPLARQARITGQVRLRVTTNGHAVTEIAVLQGHPLLAQAAHDNVGTWKLADHTPGTFEVTFVYRFIEEGTTFLKQPGLVQVLRSSRMLY